MGINVKIQKSPKPLDVITVQAKLERDLKSCMRCRVFYGSSSQCIAKRCVREDGKAEVTERDMESECFNCQYRQSDKYCFPCMKKILEKQRQEEKQDG